ncbi:MAG: glycosyltransferase family 4 protein [Actinomycetota bacterium]|nr:glycosyltransferase family 4 protein [Actinomycetota bacterium]
MASPTNLRVLRLCSVFEPPPESLRGRGARFDLIGGMQNHTASLTRALDAFGVHQDVITTRPPGATAEQRLGARSTVHRLGLPVRAFRQFYSLPAAVLVDRLAPGADLLHVHLGEDLAIVPIALAAARRHKLPWVLTVHTSLAHTFAGTGSRGLVLKHAGGQLERAGVHRADAVIALTARLAGLMERQGVPPSRIHVIPSGVVPVSSESPSRLVRSAGGKLAPSSAPRSSVFGGPDPLVRDGRPRVLFVGRLAEQKGARYLVEAAPLMRTADVDIVIVGDGPERGMLEDLTRRLRSQHRVRFAGFHPHDAIAEVLRGGDVLAMPSVYEELGSVLLEAMEAGLPIVASDTGGIRDAIGDAGVLVAPRDAAGLARALDALLADTDRRAEITAHARERAKDFHWDRLAERVLGVYDSVLEGEAREGDHRRGHKSSLTARNSVSSSSA